MGFWTTIFSFIESKHEKCCGRLSIERPGEHQCDSHVPWANCFLVPFENVMETYFYAVTITVWELRWLLHRCFKIWKLIFRNALLLAATTFIFIFFLVNSFRRTVIFFSILRFGDFIIDLIGIRLPLDTQTPGGKKIHWKLLFPPIWRESQTYRSGRMSLSILL